MTLAKAASLAGMSRCEFALVLKRVGLAAYEYTDTEYEEDLAFVASAKEF
jgi:predicted HTH domain antitoxin